MWKIWSGFLTTTTENNHLTFHLGAISSKNKTNKTYKLTSNNRGEKSFTDQISNKFIMCLTLFVSRQLNGARHILCKLWCVEINVCTSLKKRTSPKLMKISITKFRSGLKTTTGVAPTFRFYKNKSHFLFHSDWGRKNVLTLALSKV